MAITHRSTGVVSIPKRLTLFVARMIKNTFREYSEKWLVMNLRVHVLPDDPIFDQPRSPKSSFYCTHKHTCTPLKLSLISAPTKIKYLCPLALVTFLSTLFSVSRHIFSDQSFFRRFFGNIRQQNKSYSWSTPRELSNERTIVELPTRSGKCMVNERISCVSLKWVKNHS